MQSLDRLVQLARVQGILDLRCLLNGPLEIDHQPEPKGIATYHVVLAGKCLLRRPGSLDLPLAAGDIILLPHGEGHVIEIAGGGSFTPKPETQFNGAVLLRSNVTAGPASLDLLCGRFAYAHPAAWVEALPDLIHVRSIGPDLESLVDIMRREADAAQPGAQVIVGAISTALFTMILRTWLKGAPGLAGVLALLSHERISRSVLAMLDAPGTSWNIAQLARLAAMSRASFMRTYASLSSETPLESLSDIRMQLASQLLTDSKRKLGDIAAEVGYASEAAFTRRFKNTFQLTPRQFRAAHQP